MIVFDLECRAGAHRFEGWFGSSGDFAQQQQRGLVTCPQCGSADVVKAVQAPAVGRKGNQGAVARPSRDQAAPSGAISAAAAPASTMPPEAAEMMRKLAIMQTEALKQSRWVGESFADNARAMHYGEREVESIHGQATLDDAKALHEEGIEVAPLPFPVAPPGKAN